MIQDSRFKDLKFQDFAFQDWLLAAGYWSLAASTEA
jgi:hypothetical protein